MRTTRQQLARIEDKLDRLVREATSVGNSSGSSHPIRSAIPAFDELDDDQQAIVRDIRGRVGDGDHAGATARTTKWLEHEAGEVPPKVVAAVIAAILV